MALTPRIELRQNQTLVMTPQLQQAIKLLQLSNVELSAFLEEELERNPLLERADPNDEDGQGAGEPDLASDGDVGTIDTADLADRETLPRSEEEPLDLDYDTTFTSDQNDEGPAPSEAVDLPLSNWSTTTDGGSYGGTDSAIERTASDATTLKDHLISQLNIAVTDPVDRLIGGNLIDLIDDSGYLGDPIEIIAERIGCDLDRVEAMLKEIQKFDPAGIGARDLAECLALQLLERNRLDPAMEAFLDNLNLVAKRDISELCRACGVDEDDVHDMIAEVRALDPKPGLVFDSEMAQPIVPDVFIRPRPDGGWEVDLNSDTLPRVLVNQAYHASIVGRDKDQTEKSFITEQLHAANWLIKSLDQRARTILKVATELVAQQDLFFRLGVEFLKPLNLRDIAQEIDMHESTVSRVTANKYVATPRGIYAMKYFFTSAIASSAGGDAHSAEAVRHRIRELIDHEMPKSILSDDQIVDSLREQGVEIARRTVAKYREALRIPSSVVRRRQKKQVANVA